jgi:hypothetical protein
MLQIDLSDHESYESFTREATLDDVDFKLKFRYNASKDFWTMEVQDANAHAIKVYKCICNFDIMMRDINVNLPRGKLFFYTNDKTKSVTRKGDFKIKAVSLVYIPQNEWNLLNQRSTLVKN